MSDWRAEASALLDTVAGLRADLAASRERIAVLEGALRRCIPLLPREWQPEAMAALGEEASDGE